MFAIDLRPHEVSVKKQPQSVHQTCLSLVVVAAAAVAAVAVVEAAAAVVVGTRLSVSVCPPHLNLQRATC